MFDAPSLLMRTHNFREADNAAHDSEEACIILTIPNVGVRKRMWALCKASELTRVVIAHENSEEFVRVSRKQDPRWVHRFFVSIDISTKNDLEAESDILLIRKQLEVVTGEDVMSFIPLYEKRNKTQKLHIIFPSITTENAHCQALVRAALIQYRENQRVKRDKLSIEEDVILFGEEDDDFPIVGQHASLYKFDRDDEKSYGERIHHDPYHCLPLELSNKQVALSADDCIRIWMRYWDPLSPEKTQKVKER